MTLDDTALLEGARSAFDRRLDEATLRRSPASVAAVVRDGEIIATLAHGHPRRDSAPTRPETVFRIASMSKSFLAATALALRDDGMLDLHAPAAAYVPELAAVHAGGVAPTLAMLLSNQGGLTEDNAWGDDRLGESREWIAAAVRAGIALTSAPGTEYAYSNLGQAMVGRAIESVTGRAVEEVIRDRMLDPLGLSDTRATAEDYPAGTDLAAGYRTFDDGLTFEPEPYVGSGALACIGSLFSTVPDIARWMRFLAAAFDDGADDGILRASSRREMQTAHSLMSTAGWQDSPRRLDGIGYGYGLVVEHDRRFGRIVQHSGGLPGFSSHMRWHPTTGIGVIVFGNSDSFGAGGIAGDLLHQVLTAADAPARVVRPWPQTIACARQIDAALLAGDGLPEGTLTRNVLRNVPAAVRERRLNEALAQTGPISADPAEFSTRIVSAADPSALRWTIPCERGALVVDVHLVGLEGHRVQEVSVRVAAPDGRKPVDEAPLVTDHCRVDTAVL